MRLIETLLFFLILSSIISCTSIVPNENTDRKKLSNLSCPVSELEKFTSFGVYFSSLSNKDKLLECKRLRFNYKVLDDWHAGWSLAYAINDYSACGNTIESIDILQKIHENKFHNEQVQWLIEQQLILLNRLKKVQQQKVKINQTIKLSKEQLLNCQEEKNIMVLKLHELKSIETSINERLEENQNEQK